LIVEDGKIPLRAGSCARTRSFARNARVFDTALRRKAGASQGKGHPKPPPSHLQAIYLGVATLKPGTCEVQATPKPFPDQMRQGFAAYQSPAPPCPHPQ
jgi:hypothetical protein